MSFSPVFGKRWPFPRSLRLCRLGASPARAETTGDRGYYFDFLEFEKNHQKNNTPSTPSISLLYALDSMVSSIIDEGLEARFRRHSRPTRSFMAG